MVKKKTIIIENQIKETKDLRTAIHRCIYFFISPFFLLIYIAVEMNKNMIKTRTYKNTSQKLNGEN